MRDGGTDAVGDSRTVLISLSRWMMAAGGGGEAVRLCTVEHVHGSKGASVWVQVL